MSKYKKKSPANCVDQKADDNHVTDNLPSPMLQRLAQNSDEFLSALKQSPKWPDIEPELKPILTNIEEGIVVHSFDFCQKLEAKVLVEDLFNIHGYLMSQMAIRSLIHTHNELPKQALQIDTLVYHAMMSGAAFQRLQGSVPVKKLVDEWAPRIERDKVKQAGCSTGGNESAITRAKDAEERHCKVIAEAGKRLNADHSNYPTVVRTLSKLPLKNNSTAYSKRSIERILKKAAIKKKTAT